MMSTSQPHVLPHSLKREREAEPPRQEMLAVEIPVSTSFRPPACKDQSPPRSRSSSLSDISDSHAVFAQDLTASSTAPSPFDPTNGPPLKKSKLAFQQKEQEKAFKMIEKQNKERERAEEKARKVAEKEAERKKKEEERQVKEDERKKAAAEKEEKRLAKELEKLRKTAEQQRIEDEKKKKDASQKKLSAFFGAPSQPKSNPAAVNKAVEDTPETKDVSEYEKLFPSFWYNTEHTTVAPKTRFARDQDATQNLHIQLDHYIYEPQPTHSSFDPKTLFHLSVNNSRQRGRHIRPVRSIMTESTGSSQKPIDLTAASSISQNPQTRDLVNQLRAIPVKILEFHEDVRPPYIGTRTSVSHAEISKLARAPCKKLVEQLDYDYDSEAEWMEPEEGEELLSGDEEEEEDEDEEMDDFLDDSEAAPLGGVVARNNLSANMEIENTGLCWEDANGTNANSALYKNSIEILHHNKLTLPIDPYSTAYWAMNPPRRPLTTKGANSTLAMPLPSNSFSAVKALQTQTAHTHDAKVDKLVRAEDLNAFKELVKDNALSQVGLVEVLHLSFPNNTKAVIKNTLLRVAVKEKGKGGVWRLVGE